MTVIVKKFKDLNISRPAVKTFVGDSIPIKKIMGQEIIIHFYEIEPSKFIDKGDGNRLSIQIEYKGEKRIVWSNSMGLRKMISDVKKEDFPISVKIIEEDERFYFE